MRCHRSPCVRQALLFVLALGMRDTFAHATASDGRLLLDHRVEFRLIDPQDSPAQRQSGLSSRPTAADACQFRRFQVPGPGQMQVQILVSPWFRNSDPVVIRMADGQKRGVGTGSDHAPGLQLRDRFRRPDEPMEGCALMWVDTYEIPAKTAELHFPATLELAICPSTLLLVDGSVHQYRNAVTVRIEWAPADVQLTSQADRLTAVMPRCTDDRPGTREQGHAEQVETPPNSQEQQDAQ